jgi:hypothetical protein
LRSVLDLEAGRLALARRRWGTARGLNAVDSVDTALGETLGVLEVQPLDRALVAETRASRRRRSSVVELADLCNGERRRELVEDEGGSAGAVDGLELVSADTLVIALRLEAPLERAGEGAQSQSERRERSDLPHGHGVSVELGTDVVKGSCNLLIVILPPHVSGLPSAPVVPGAASGLPVVHV